MEAKAQWFSQWEKWKLNLLPGTLKVTLIDAGNANVIFDVRYRYSPKDKASSPIVDTAHVTLDMVKEDGAWRIEAENLAVGRPVGFAPGYKFLYMNVVGSSRSVGVSRHQPGRTPAIL